MLRLNGILCRATLALGALIAVTAPALTQRPGRLAALARLEPGLWELRDLRDGRVKHASICLGDSSLLLQPQHRDAPCSRLVVAQDARSATVHYTCTAGGYGQTSLRVETPRLVQIDTQGIRENVPFAYRAEARRIGECGGNGSRGR